MDSLITADRIVKRFGDQAILKKVSLQVNPGERLAILGRSGSGKTTLLRTLLGLYTPDEGSISYARSINPKRDFGYVTQLNAFHDELTVEQNIYYFASLFDCTSADVPNGCPD